MEHTFEYLKGSIIGRYGKEAFTDSVYYSVRFNCFGQTNMCMEWIKDGMKVSLEEMARRNVENIPEPLRKFFLV